jgi:hypothetical protein
MFAALVISTLVGAFGPGEQTKYEVSLLGVTAGSAQVTVGWPMEQFGKTVWPLVCVGQTTNVGVIFPVKDRFISYWEPTSQQTAGADFFVDERNERRRERFTYDRAALTAVARKQKEGQAPYEKRYEMHPDTMDLAAAGFWLRNVPLSIGLEKEVPIFTGAKVYRMVVKVEGRERLATRLGELEVFRVTINGDFPGELATRSRIKVFYTADQKQLPVRAEADFALGSVVLEAISYEPGQEAAQ